MGGSLSGSCRCDALRCGAGCGDSLWRCWLRDRRPSWRMVAAGVLAVTPFLVYLTLTFGSPLPLTLVAKRLQSEAGVTGFYAGTGYLAGLGISCRDGGRRHRSTPLPSPCWPWASGVRCGRPSGVWPVLLWGVAHVVAYIGLGVAPYFWYAHAPLAPAVAWLLALGAATLARWLSDRTRLSRSAGMAVVTTIALAPLVISLSSIRRSSTGLVAAAGLTLE